MISQGTIILRAVENVENDLKDDSERLFLRIAGFRITLQHWKQLYLCNISSEVHLDEK